MKTLFLCDNDQPQTVAALCAARGFGVEIQGFAHPNRVADPALLAAALPQLEPVARRSLHGVFYDLCPGSPDPLIRAVTRQRLEQSAAAGRALGVQEIVFHHGYVPGTSSRAGWMSRAPAFWKDFLSAQPPGLAFHLENLLEWEPGFLAELLDRVGDPRLDACLDVGHAHCYSRAPVLEWVRGLGQRIGFVHLHDNRGADDEHLAFGEGTLPLEETLHALEEHCPGASWMIEVTGEGLLRSLDWLDARGFLGQ
jgi:sugar phosphate isomerase/epimerase